MIPIKTFGNSIQLGLFCLLINTISLKNAPNNTIKNNVKSIQDTILNSQVILSNSNFLDKKGNLNYVQGLMYLINLDISKADSSTKATYYTQLGTLLSFCGDSQEAIRRYDSSNFFNRYYTQFKPSKADSTFLDKIKVKEAHSYLLSAANKTKLFIISEEHHVTSQRLFTYSLLKDLYASGYRYLALEALGIQEIKAGDTISINPKIGYYVNEPTMANMIRYANKLGFNVIGYDCSNCKSVQERENKSAEKLIKILRNSKKGKVVIHCGYAHGSKTSMGNLNTLGKILKDSTGIEPISVAQHILSKGYDRGYKSFAYDYLKNKVKKSSILFIGDKPLDLTGISAFDYIVINPENEKSLISEVIKESNLKLKPIKLSKAEAEGGFLLQLLPTSESKSLGLERVVPAFQNIIGKRQKINALIPPGKYEIVIRDYQNHILSKTSLTVF